jgi:hypothetical protein
MKRRSYRPIGTLLAHAPALSGIIPAWTVTLFFAFSVGILLRRGVHGVIFGFR